MSRNTMALIETVREGQTEQITALLSKGVDVNQTDDDGNTPLITAARYYQTEIARLLIDHQANIHAKNNRRETAWHWAAMTDNAELIELLVQQGVDPNTKLESGNWESCTALMIAAYIYDGDLAHFLIEHGADINIGSDDGETALMKAADQGHLRMVRYLVEQGADIHAKTVENYTALIFAAGEGHHEIVAYLIEQGASPNTRYDGWTTLMLAAKQGFLETMKILLEQGAEIDATVEEEGWRGFTALMYAVVKGQTESVCWLLDHGANVNAKNDKGASSLIWAVKFGFLDIVELLVDHGADIDATDQEGETALTYAQLWGQPEILNFLIKKGGKRDVDRGFGWRNIRKRLVCQFPKATIFVSEFLDFMKGEKRPLAQPPPPPRVQKSLLQPAELPETLNVRWSYEIPEAVCIGYGNWEGDGNLKILAADNDKQLYILNVEGNMTDTLTLPAQFDTIECGWHQEYGIQLLGGTPKGTKFYVIDRHGKTRWRYSGWLQIQPHWGDLNGDGNDEIVVRETGKLLALTARKKVLWKIAQTPFSAISHAIIPSSSFTQKTLVLALTYAIKVYNQSGKLLRTLQLDDGSSLTAWSYISGAVMDASGTIQIAVFGLGAKEDADEVLTFDLAGNVIWKTVGYIHPLFTGNFFACEDMNGDGVREWAFMENPGELVFVSPHGEKLATLSVSNDLEQFLIVPQPDGYGMLVTLQAGIVTAYQFEREEN